MATLIDRPSVIEAAGTKPKLIEEYIGRVNSQTEGVSIAHMHSPAGWTEPGQTPEFAEYTLVLKGELRVETRLGQGTTFCLAFPVPDFPADLSGAVSTHSTDILEMRV